METHTIFFIGKPGSGKGDQARLLSEKTGWKVITAGEQFRAIATEDTPAGRKTKSEMSTGLLSPHWFAMYLFLKSLFSLSDDESVIFDGFCRKVPEAELVIDSLRWIGRPFSLVHLIVSDEEIKHRIALRKGVEGRADDNAVEERLKEYRTYTEPAIEKVREAGNLIEVNGEGTREAIAEEIRKVLNIK
jgi:adenylate kinase